jgi:hypothetical protein
MKEYKVLAYDVWIDTYRLEAELNKYAKEKWCVKSQSMYGGQTQRLLIVLEREKTRDSNE